MVGLPVRVPRYAILPHSLLKELSILSGLWKNYWLPIWTPLVHAQAQIVRQPLIYHLLYAMITFGRLACHQVKHGVISFMLTTLRGMVKVVVQLAHAEHSTIHHGFVNNYLSQLMLIWKSDCAHIVQYLLKTLQ